MKQQCWWIAGVLCAAQFSMACGEDEPDDPLDPSTFAGMNADKINYDCTHTVQCDAQNGEDLAEDPINTCIKNTARFLQDHPDQQTQYISNVTRCQSQIVCDYKSCALQDAQGSYGQTQIEKVSYNCQQDVECRRQLGTLVGEPTAEYDSCVANNVGWLDTFSPDQRVQYESGYMACAGRLACDFTNCFQF